MMKRKTKPATLIWLFYTAGLVLLFGALLAACWGAYVRDNRVWNQYRWNIKAPFFAPAKVDGAFLARDSGTVYLLESSDNLPELLKHRWSLWEKQGDATCLVSVNELGGANVAKSYISDLWIIPQGSGFEHNSIEERGWQLAMRLPELQVLSDGRYLLHLQLHSFDAKALKALGAVPATVRAYDIPPVLPRFWAPTIIGLSICVLAVYAVNGLHLILFGLPRRKISWGLWFVLPWVPVWLIFFGTALSGMNVLLACVIESLLSAGACFSLLALRARLRKNKKMTE